MNFNFNIEDIKYIKILCKDGFDRPKSIKAAIKQINDKEIVACAKFDGSFNLTLPQDITLSIVCNEGLYRTITVLRRVEQAEPYLFFYVLTPKGFEYQQNREYFRVCAKYSCMYYINDFDKTESYPAETYDISANGVSIILPNEILSDNDSEIDLMIDERLVHAKIRYIRSEKVEFGYKLSFTYTKISDSDRDYISQICIKNQLKQRRNSTLR